MNWTRSKPWHSSDQRTCSSRGDIRAEGADPPAGERAWLVDLPVGAGGAGALGRLGGAGAHPRAGAGRLLHRAPGGHPRRLGLHVRPARVPRQLLGQDGRR